MLNSTKIQVDVKMFTSLSLQKLNKEYDVNIDKIHEQMEHSCQKLAGSCHVMQNSVGQIICFLLNHSYKVIKIM